MNSQKFGPVAWSLLHTIPRLIAPQDRTEPWCEQIRESFALLLSGHAMVLPCSFCRDSYRVFIRVLDLRKWVQGPLLLQPVCTNSAEMYVYTLHNLVNQKLDKPWHPDMCGAVAQNMLVDERSFMTALFEWLYMLFLNYPQDLCQTVCSTKDDECCAEHCRRANDSLALKRNETAHSEPQQDGSAVRQQATCVAASLSRALEHVKRQVGSISYLANANAQGVTLGSFLNQHLIKPAYINMLGGDARKQIDFYTFSKICWYIIYMHSIVTLLRYSSDNHTVRQLPGNLTNRSADAMRSLWQVQQTFLERHCDDNEQRCICAAQSGSACREKNLGAWASSADAVSALHFCRRLWDGTTEPLQETRTRIERYRASGKH